MLLRRSAERYGRADDVVQVDGVEKVVVPVRRIDEQKTRIPTRTSWMPYQNRRLLAHMKEP